MNRLYSIGGNSKLPSLSSNSNKILIIVAIIVIIAVAVYCYYVYVSPSSKLSYNPNHEKVPIGSGGGNGSVAELLFFYADWCPHCKTAKPIWNELKTEYQNKTINGYTIVFTEVNCSEETPEVDQMMNKYNVEGYPTIKLIKDGQVIEYDAKPDKNTLIQFLNTVL